MNNQDFIIKVHNEYEISEKANGCQSQAAKVLRFGGLIFQYTEMFLLFLLFAHKSLAPIKTCWGIQCMGAICVSF